MQVGVAVEVHHLLKAFEITTVNELLGSDLLEEGTVVHAAPRNTFDTRSGVQSTGHLMVLLSGSDELYICRLKPLTCLFETDQVNTWIWCGVINARQCHYVFWC
jgi:hypothetical protein